jgi:hypothetical protein
MSKSDDNIPTSSLDIKQKILSIRGEQVMVDRDLAEFYNVPTKRLNEQVKRNIERFPETFRFQLNSEEKNELVANCDRFHNLKHSSVNPYVFTEQGVAMLAGILRSDTALRISIQIISAFVTMRRFLVNNASIFQRLDNLEYKQIQTDKKLDNVLNALQSNKKEQKQGIFFEGNIFDAYKFVSGLIRKAQKDITLIDNYIDETILTLFSKKKPDVNVKIYTRQITKALKLDVQKFNEQYPKLTVEKFERSHDRFLIIDNKDVYHFGASLKDLGKKWFAFSKFDKYGIDLLSKLNK